MAIRELILLRHAVSEYNCVNRMQGQLDIPLTAEGHRQAKEVTELLASIDPLAIYSSDLQRAKDTAAPLAARCSLELILDERLRETALGQWEGLDHEKVDASWPGVRQLWRNDPQLQPPGGETKVQVAHRGSMVIDEIIDNYPHWGQSSRPIVIVSHGGFIAALTAHLLQLPLPLWGVLGKLANTGWAVLQQFDQDVWRLSAWNRALLTTFDQYNTDITIL